VTDPNRPSGATSSIAALVARSRRALPPPGQAFFGTLLWAAAMAASAVLNLLLDAWVTPAKIRVVALLFIVGGAMALAPGLLAARLLSLGRGGEVAFAAAFTCLLTSTIGFTGCLFGLQYRLYYSDWHEPVSTHLGLIEFVSTIAAGAYQFLVLGVRLYFPFGFVALLAFSLWFARQAR
jgi:hypothetical protein